MPQETVPFDQDYYQDESFVEAPKAPKLFEPSYIIPRLLFRWYWIVIGLAIGLAYGFISIKLATPFYKTQTTVRVVESTGSNENNLEKDILVTGKDAADAVREKFALSSVRKAVAEDPSIRSLANLRIPPEKTIQDLLNQSGDANPNDSEFQAPMTTEELSAQIASWVDIQNRKGSRLIDISVLHPDPIVAQKVSNRMVHYYQELRKTGFESKTGDKIKTTEESIEYANNQLAESGRVQKIYEPAILAEEEFLKAKKALDELGLTLGKLHPRMKQAQKFFDNKDAELKRALSLAIESTQDQNYWRYVKDTTKDLVDSAAIDRARLLVRERVSAIKNEISSIKNRREADQEMLSGLQQSNSNAKDEITVEEEAVLPKFPHSPNRRNMMTKGAVYGLAAGLALAFLFQLFDNKVGSVAEAEQAYGLPILSAIRKLPDEKTMEAEKAALLDLPHSFSGVHPNLAVTGWASDPVYSEMFRVLRASVSLLGDASERNVTLVSSSIPGEGKTFVAANLALAYAKQGTRTLLIDFDLRKPAVHKIFGQPRHGFQGIVNVLNGTAGLGDVIATFEGFTNLSVIFSGTKSPSPGELLEPAKLYSIIEAYAGNFDHVVIDSAPLLPVPDTRIIAPLAHNFCLVVRADHTPRKATYSALELLAADGLSPSGIVLNDFVEKRMQGGKYGYGYGYGEYGETEEDEDA